MNKKFLVSVIVLIVVGTWFFSKEENQVPSPVERVEVQSEEKILLPNVKTPEWDQFSSRLTQKLKESEVNDNLLDFSLSAEQLKAKNGPKNIGDSLRNIVSTTLQCYKEDECGFEHPPEGEYDDPTEIPALKTLKRQLQLALELGIDIPSEELMESVQLPNDAIRESAFSLLLRKSSQSDLSPLFDKVESLDGKSFGPMMKGLLKASQKSPGAFDELFKRFVRTLEEKDPYTAIEALESFRGLKLEQFQFEDLARVFCSWRQKADQNWLAAKKNLEEIATQQKLSFNSASICY